MGSNPPHSTAKTLRLTVISVACGLAMAVSAVAGAWVQSQFHEVRDSSSLRAGSQVEASQLQADYIRESVGALATKVGEVQARLIAVEGLGQRVADAAGVNFTEPELHAALEQSFLESRWSNGTSQLWTAETLGRELDFMARELAAGEERLQMLDTMLTQRNGVKEAMPSLTPVDHPFQSSSFGWRRHPVTGRHSMHEGLDFAAPRGAPIVAASGGVVTEARYVPGYGKMVEIDHGNGLATRYAHASSISVKLGEVVTKGQQIARVGSTGRSTGPHLHYEVRIAGHPLDPTLFMVGAKSDEDEPSVVASAGNGE